MGVVILRLKDFRFVGSWSAVVPVATAAAARICAGSLRVAQYEATVLSEERLEITLTPICQNRRVESNGVGSHPQNHHRELRRCTHQCPVGGFVWVVERLPTPIQATLHVKTEAGAIVPSGAVSQVVRDSEDGPRDC